MKKLIEALNIFLKYKDEEFPTCCSHDAFMVAHITKEEVSLEDRERLVDLGFEWSDDYDCWVSYLYGSC